jgi:hypothetical protein
MAKKAKAVASTVRDNPKTTVSGLIGLAALIGSIWAPVEMQPKIQQTVGVLATSGLIFVATDPAKK